MVQGHRFRCHTEHPGEPALEADRDVAQPDRAVPGVEQGAGDDTDRVGEVDDPGAGSGQSGRPLRDVEHHGDGAQRLGEPTRPRGLLADAAALQRERLIRDPGLLAAYPQLSEVSFSAQNRLWDTSAQSESDPAIRVYSNPKPAYGSIGLTLKRD